MSDAFSKAFGPKRPQGEIAQEPQMSAQEKMMMGMLKQFIPGFDLNQIKKLGDDIGQTVEFFRVKTDELHKENMETQRLLRIIALKLGANPDELPQPPDDGRIQADLRDILSRG